MMTYWDEYCGWCRQKGLNPDEYQFAAWMLIQNRMQIEKEAQSLYEQYFKPSINVHP